MDAAEAAQYAHPEQAAPQRPRLHDQGIDVVDLDIGDPYGIEMDLGGGAGAVRGHRLVAEIGRSEVDAEQVGVFAPERQKGRAGIDDDMDDLAIDIDVGQIVAARVRGDLDTIQVFARLRRLRYKGRRRACGAAWVAGCDADSASLWLRNQLPTRLTARTAIKVERAKRSMGPAP